jgi:hypothetical protein
VTALAASLGAPFWFDTLNRFINIRENGCAPEEKTLPTKNDPGSVRHFQSRPNDRLNSLHYSGT